MPFQMRGLRYRADGRWLERISYYWLGKFVETTLGTGTSPPVRYINHHVIQHHVIQHYVIQWKKFLQESLKIRPSLQEITSRLGFDDFLVELCKPIEKDICLRALYIMIPYIIFAWLIIVMPFFYIQSFLTSHALNWYLGFSEQDSSLLLTIGLGVAVGTSFLAIIPSFIFLLLLLKIILFIVDRNFASSMAATTLIYLLIELNHSEVLFREDMKTLVMQRMNNVIRYMRLISLQMSKLNKDHSIWIKEHFAAIEAFIRERQRWAAAPLATTNLDLERDFRYLASIFISKKFGEFSWQPQLLDTKKVQVPTKTSLWSRFWQPLIAVLPLGILSFLLWRKEVLTQLNIAPQIVSLILISWLLILVDHTLKLGVIESIVSIAKGIKEIGR